MSYDIDELPVSPNSVLRPDTLGPDADAFFLALEPFREQLMGYMPFLVALSGTAPISVVYTFRDVTSGDPGAGGFRLNHATQTSATGSGADDVDANGADATSVTAKMGVGTSDIKGDLLITLADDPTVKLTFDVTGGSAPGGYRGLVLQNGTGSSASPFADGDLIRVTYTRNGDKGSAGPSNDPGPHAIYQEQRASGTGSSTPRVGASNNVVALNTEVHDSLGIFSISGNTITISQAGTYVFRGRAWAYGTNGLQLNIYNTTDGTVVGDGDSCRAIDYGSSVYFPDNPPVLGVVTIAGAKSFQMRAYIGQAGPTDAFGIAVNSGRPEIYATLEITKKA